MKIIAWLHRRRSKTNAAEDVYCKARMESSRKKLESADSIIETLKKLQMERRIMSAEYAGPERRGA